MKCPDQNSRGANTITTPSPAPSSGEPVTSSLFVSNKRCESTAKNSTPISDNTHAAVVEERETVEKKIMHTLQEPCVDHSETTLQAQANNMDDAYSENVLESGARVEDEADISRSAKSNYGEGGCMTDETTNLPPVTTDDNDTRGSKSGEYAQQLNGHNNQQSTPKATISIPLKSSPPDRTSLLTRGMSLFAKSSKQLKSAAPDDAMSVMSELSKDPKFDDDDDNILIKHLEESGLVLLKRLIEFLSECPPIGDDRGDVQRHGSAPSDQKKRQRGLTLPASAIGWLSSQLIENSYNDAIAGVAGGCRIPKQQLECLQLLLKRVTSLRITGDAWPPTHASAVSKAANLDKTGISTRIMSKITGDQSAVGGDIDDDDSCGTSPPKVEAEVVVSAFQRYYHELQYNPDVNMSFFPNATKLVIGGIPPRWVTNLDMLQNLTMFQMEKGCILDINNLFFPSDLTMKSDSKGASEDSSRHMQRNFSLVNEDEERDGPQLADGNITAPAVYPNLAKLRLSNCAIGETAGLRGRKNSQSVARTPTLSRFPNLTSLNISHNELFKTKSVFAGLSSLPLLSSINLSYNRLSSLDDIFMHIGNVTELILTGNEISSSRGLDRIFSLERLSLDENRIQSLANISGIAKIPFLMNFDIKGNPIFEGDDPMSCRIKVFNLFREVRCNSLPKNATFRDMQSMLPILDNEIATKDELIALKDLTFRQTVTPVESMLPPESKDGYTSSKIDESSEISVNMPDPKSGLRRIAKSFPTKLAHFRIVGPLSGEMHLPSFRRHLDRRARGKVTKSNEVDVQFDNTELIASIRPKTLRDQVSYEKMSSGGLRTSSFSSDQSEDCANSPEAPFPFGIPSSLLAEAPENVWAPFSRLDLISPSDDIVWDINTDGDFNQNASLGLRDESETEVHDDRKETADGSYETIVSSDVELQAVSSGQVQESSHNSALNDLDGDEAKSRSKSRKSMFDGIWEQSNDESTLEPTAVIDFIGAEQNAQYDGPPDYRPLFVSSDLDLYFDSYIFRRDSSDEDMDEDDVKERKGLRLLAPRIQLFKFDRELLMNEKHKSRRTAGQFAADFFQERYIGVWKENVLACGSYARSRLAPKMVPRKGFHGDTLTRAGKDILVAECRKFVLCLSDSALYFIIDDQLSTHMSIGGKRPFPSAIPLNSTFADGYWPHALIRHPLDCLSGITIGFQFQRLILKFRVRNSTTLSSVDYTYVIMTSDKLRTVDLLQKLQSHVTDAQKQSALIDNDDKAFLDALGAPKTNEVVMHYQILQQIWKHGERGASRRAFVLTDAKVYLLDETYNGDSASEGAKYLGAKKLGDISLVLIDSASLRHVTEIRAANEDPKKITLVILPKNKLKRSHRWRLVCNDGEGAERLIDDVRKAIRGYSLS